MPNVSKDNDFKAEITWIFMGYTLEDLGSQQMWNRRTFILQDQTIEELSYQVHNVYGDALLPSEDFLTFMAEMNDQK